MQEKIVHQNSTCPISNVLYHDVIDKVHSDNEEEMQNAISIFKKLYPKGEYLYIRHKSEENEGSDHIHILLRNNTSNGFNNIPKLRSDVFFETCKVDTKDYKIGEQKPCSSFRTSLIGDWLGYALHNPEYLEKMGVPRKKYVYEISDVKGDKNFLLDCQEALENILHPKCKKTSNNVSEFDLIKNCVINGMTDLEILSQLPLEAHQIQSALKGIRSIRKLTTVFEDETGYHNAISEIVPYIWEKLEERCGDLSNIEYNRRYSTSHIGKRIQIVEILLDRFIDSIHGIDVLECLLECK